MRSRSTSACGSRSARRSAAHDVVAPRLYGRGPTMDAWASSVAAELDGDAAVVGASMGGYCALALARRAPERVRGLLLVGARPDADSDERRAGRADTIELIHNEGPEGLWRSMLPKLFADESFADERLLFRDADALVGAVEAIRDRADSTAVARAFERPVQFVVGESRSVRLRGRARGIRRPRAARCGPPREHRAPGRVQRDPGEFLGACLSSRQSSTSRGSRPSSAPRISFLGDVRGPNAHARGHIPRLEPARARLPAADERSATCCEALAPEVGLRLRRHGVTGEERLVLYDRGDGVGAMPAAQMAELAGHPRVAVLLGGLAAWPGELETGQVELHPVKTTFEPDSERCRRATSSRAGSTTRADDPRRPLGGGVPRQARLSVRPAPGPHPGRAPSCPCRSSSPAPGSRCRATRSARRSATRPRSLRTATRARARRWRRSRCAARDSARATTPARGTSGRATRSCRSSAASLQAGARRSIWRRRSRRSARALPDAARAGAAARARLHPA